MKYKEMLKKNDNKDSDGTSTSEKVDQAGIVKQVDENSCDVLTTRSGNGKYSDIWLLDLGCTYHMCPKREFSTYKPYDEDSVLMGNNAVRKTVGIGNIRMRIFYRQARTLTNVRHVPDLKKNLFSLRALEAQGCKFFGADGGIKVI